MLWLLSAVVCFLQNKLFSSKYSFSVPVSNAILVGLDLGPNYLQGYQQATKVIYSRLEN